jgi:hypothetical protein
MKVRRWTRQLAYSLIGVLVLTGSWPSHASAQDARAQTSQHHGPTSDQKAPAGDLVKVVRAVTERFRDVSVAEAEGYTLLFGCVSGSDWGAMGLHYVNLKLVDDGNWTPRNPRS